MSTNQIILLSVSVAVVAAGLYGWILCKAAKRGDTNPAEPEPDEWGHSSWKELVQNDKE